MTPSTPEPTEHECSVCFNITSAQEEALGSYDNGGKKIVCDPACLDGVTDPIHCNCEYNTFTIFSQFLRSIGLSFIPHVM